MTDRERPDRHWQDNAPLVFAEDVLEEWRWIACADRPWSEMYLDDLTGHLRPVIEELLRPSDDMGRGHRRLRLYRAARAHGSFRRRQGCLGQVLAEEVAFVEEAIANVLLRNSGTRAVVMTVLDLLAPEIRSIERAAYGGFVDWVDVPETGT